MRSSAETFIITLAALATSLVLFAAFMMLASVYSWLFDRGELHLISPADLYYWIYVGGFGTRSSWENTLTRAAPLILTALCTALPARVGLIIIGGEGALVLGGLAAVWTGLALQNAPVTVIWSSMAVTGMIVGGLSIAAIGALRYGRGVNETIASLLYTYIAIGVFNYLVEGPMRDPSSLNKPSTFPIPEFALLGKIPGLNVHWGLAVGIIFCVAAYVLMEHTTFGFGARMVGGNLRAAQASGLPVGRLMLLTCFLGGAAAGLAGMIEVAAEERAANGALIANYGFMGILVSFLARHHPLGIIPVAILFGGLNASSGVLMRHLHVPNASVNVLMGIVFVTILLFETFYGRFRVFTPREVREVQPA